MKEWVLSGDEMIEGTTFKKGGVELVIDRDSLARTLTAVESLSPEELRSITDAYGQTIGKGQPLATLLMIAKSYIQNEWLLEVKGEIPMATQKNHDDRSKKAAAEGNGDTKKAKAPKEAKAARAERTYAFAGKVADLEGMKGHAGLVALALKNVGKGKLADIITEVKKGPEYKSKHELEVSVRGNLAGLVRKGLAKVIEA